MRPIDADKLLKGIEELRQSPWYNFGRIENDSQEIGPEESFYHRMYLERKEAVDVIVEQCINKEPTIKVIPVKHGRWIRKHNSFPQRYFCTECGGGDVGRFAFCHHCGVEMDGDSE
jgi:hypothetical protein